MRAARGMPNSRRSDAQIDQLAAHLICHLSGEVAALTEVSAEWQQLASCSVLHLRPKAPLDVSGLHARFPYLRSLDLKLQHSITAQQLSGLTRFEQLQCVSLENCNRVTDTMLADLAGCQVIKLNLRGCSMLTWAGLGQLSRLPVLQHLNCSGVKYLSADCGSTNIPPMLVELRSLTLGDACTLSFVDDTLLELVGQHATKLQHLDCSGCIDINDQGVAHLGGLSQLESLSLQSCMRLTDRSLGVISQHFASLSHLNLRGCLQVSDTGVAKLATLKRMEDLSLKGCMAVRGAAFELFQQCPELQKLNLSHCGNVSTVKHLADLTALRSLNISHCSQLDLTSLSVLSSLHAMTCLDVSHCKNLNQPDVRTVDVALSKLAALKGLKELDISHFKHHQGLPRGFMAAIAAMTSLTYLNLTGSPAAPCTSPGLGDDDDDGFDSPLLDLKNDKSEDAEGSLWFVSTLTNLEHLDISGWRKACPSDLKALVHLVKLKGLRLNRFGNESQHRTCLSDDSDDSSQPSASAAFGNNNHRTASCSETTSLQSLESQMAAIHVQGGVNDVEALQVCSSPEQLSGSWVSSSATNNQYRMDEDSFCVAPTPLDCAMQHLRGMAQLQSISLEACLELTDDGLLELSALSSLTSIDIGGCRHVNGSASFPALASACRRLESLALSDCRQLTNTSVSSIGSMTSLRSLSLSRCTNVGDDGLVGLKTLHRLSALNMESLPLVTSRSLKALAQLPQLKSLSMPCCPGVEDGGMHELATARRLTWLDVSHCWRLTPAALDRLKGVKPVLELKGSGWV